MTGKKIRQRGGKSEEPKGNIFEVSATVALLLMDPPQTTWCRMVLKEAIHVAVEEEQKNYPDSPDYADRRMRKSEEPYGILPTLPKVSPVADISMDPFGGSY